MFYNISALGNNIIFSFLNLFASCLISYVVSPAVIFKIKKLALLINKFSAFITTKWFEVIDHFIYRDDKKNVSVSKSVQRVKLKHAAMKKEKKKKKFKIYGF